MTDPASTTSSNGQPLPGPGTKRQVSSDAAISPPKRQDTGCESKPAAITTDTTEDGNPQSFQERDLANPKSKSKSSSRSNSKSKSRFLPTGFIPQHFPLRPRLYQYSPTNIVGGLRSFISGSPNQNVYQSLAATAAEPYDSSTMTACDDDWVNIESFASGQLGQYRFAFPPTTDGWQEVHLLQAPKTRSVEESTVKQHSPQSEDKAGLVKAGDLPDQSKSEHNQTKQEVTRPLACPYLKKNPGEYRCCQKYGFQKIKEVKQHLRRRHMLHGFICRRCQLLLESHDALMDHITQEVPCTTRPPLYDRITEHQRLRLMQYPSRGKSLEQQWYGVWDIIFPGLDRPKDIYLQTEAETTMNSLWSLWDEQKKDIICDALESVPSSMLPGMELHSVFDRVMKSAMNRFTEKMAKENMGKIQSEEKTLDESSYGSESSSSVYSTPSQGFGEEQSNVFGNNVLNRFNSFLPMDQHETFAPIMNLCGSISPETTYSATFSSVPSVLEPYPLDQATSTPHLPTLQALTQSDWFPELGYQNTYPNFPSMSISPNLESYDGTTPPDHLFSHTGGMGQAG